MTDTPRVDDWATDWDHHDPRWVDDPFPIWDDLRTHCPVAHTDRYNEGVWLPTRFDDVTAVARDTDTFSSGHNGVSAGGSRERGKFPPIHLDPPEHGPIRRELLPFFAPARVAGWESSIRTHCEELAEGLAGQTEVDIAADYAAHIPAAAIAMILGIDAADGARFRTWVHGLELGDNNPDVRDQTIQEMAAYFGEAIERSRSEPGDDLIGHLVDVEVDGKRLDDATLQRLLSLQLVAGIDTTWGVLGASLWHLATHADDRRRLVADPSMIPTAVEEFLRAFASVSLWRLVRRPGVIGDTPVSPGDTVMMAFPAACRDPAVFDDADHVIIDRQQNRHVAFGAGIHRCLGSNLARLELNIAIETWLRRFPDFELVPDGHVTWAEGAIRGPRSIPVRL
jgi:cytochrome P450